MTKSFNSIPTEPVGSVPRPRELQEAMVAFSNNKHVGERTRGDF